MKNTISNSPTEVAFDRDVFSSGQVGSKLWLCENLEQHWNSRLGSSVSARIWIYGGWQGLLGFLLLSRGKLSVEQVRSFDLDEKSTNSANALNENWVWKQWKFRAFTEDANLLKPSEPGNYGPPPNLLLNTSVEHFPHQPGSGGQENASWWTTIPSGCYVGLQASDHAHQDCTSHASSRSPQTLGEFSARFPLAEVWWEGELEFDYGDWKLRRWMKLGRK